VIAYKGKVSSTPLKKADLSGLAASLSVWWLQTPARPFEAMTSAVFNHIENQK
jgi:hypothetical protein